MHRAEPGSLRDGAHPPVGPRGSGYKRDSRGLVALAENPEGAVASLKAEIFDVRRARFTDPGPTLVAETRGYAGSTSSIGGPCLMTSLVSWTRELIPSF